MNCKKVEQLLIFYIDRELSDKEMAQVSSHIGECASCATKMEFMKSNLAYFDTMQEVKVKPFLYMRIVARMQELVNIPVRRVLVFMSIAATIMLGVLMGNFIVNKTMSFKVHSDYDVAYLFDDSNLEKVECFLTE